MGRRKERSGFGRRQVLQLDDSKREDSPYRGQGGSWPIKNEGNALSGLVAHYGDSDVSEEEEEEAPPPLPEEPSPPEEPSEPDAPKNKQNGHAPEKENKANVSLDIDSKVANFLAEIDALDTDKADDIDGEPMMEVEMETEDSLVEGPPLPETNPSNQASEESESVDSEPDTLDAPVPPEAPVTVWQHCQDENTQYFYYWNTVTNEVTWEIPTQYSQYLLQLKEHDEALSRYEAKKTQYEASLKEKRSKNKEKTKPPKPNADEGPVVPAKEEEAPPHRVEKKDIKPWLLKKIRETYGDKYDTTQAEEKPPLPTTEPAVEIGPQLPPGMEASQEPPQEPEIGPQLPSSDPNDLDGKKTVEPVYNNTASLTQETVASNINRLPDHDVTVGPMPRPEGFISESKTTVLKSRENGLKISYDESEDETEDMTEEGPSFIGPQLPALAKNEEKETEEEVKVEQEEIMEEEEEDEEADLDFIDKQLEEPFMAMGEKKKVVKKEEEVEMPVSPRPVTVTKVEEEKQEEGELEEEKEEEDEDVEFDIDDIDQQLDMALEKKTAEQKTDKDRSPFSGKRKHSADSDVEKKKARSNAEPAEAVTAPKKKIDKEEIKMKAEVADLSALITDKLEFLEVTRKGLSKLQILLIETETRISDWREGALGTRYLLGRLQDAELQLQQYESSAAPPGWACHWDRTYKRYFYFHTSTGASQWDYPDDDGSKVLNKSDAISSSGVADPAATDKSETVSSSQVDGDGDAAGMKEAIPAQYALIDSTTFSTDASGKTAGSSSGTSNLEPGSSSEGVSAAKPSFPVDPSLFQDLFAPAPPPPSEPPPPGVELASHVIGPPRPPPGLPNPIPLSRSPPPPPPGTTPPRASTTTTTSSSTAPEEPDPSDVTTMDPTTTSLLAAAPPPPPPPEDVTTSTVNASHEPYNYPGVMAQPYISNLPSGAPLAIPTAMVNPSTIVAQPVISNMPAVSSSTTTTVAPPTTYILNQPTSAHSTPPDTPPRPSQQGDASSIDGVPLSDTAPQAAQQSSSTSPSTSQQQQQQTKEKKRKKEKKSSMGLSLKKKKLPSLVAKWQEVHEAVEREVSKHKKEEDSP